MGMGKNDIIFACVFSFAIGAGFGFYLAQLF
jgi:hypothetical protein